MPNAKPPAADRLVRVTFRKQVSDGNYGTEAAELTIEDTLPAGADDEEVQILAEGLLLQARRQVQTELANSMSPAVVRAVQRHRTAPAASLQEVNELAGSQQGWR